MNSGSLGLVQGTERATVRSPVAAFEPLRPGTMTGHGYVTLPSRQVGAVLGDSDVSTCAAWSTGHSAKGATPPHSSHREEVMEPLLRVTKEWMVGQASWVNP